MSKEEIIKVDGKVLEVLPNAMFRVQIDNTDHTILVYTTGKMRKKRIKIMQGDRVEVEMSPYDMERGRIVYRHKDGGKKDSPN